MSATVLPELAAESVETAERLGRLSADVDLEVGEAEYILTTGLAAIQRVPRLWPIIRRRIGAGTTGAHAHQLLARMLDVVDRNLSLAGKLKDPARIVSEELGRKPEAAAELAVAEERLREIRTETTRLLRVVDTPAPWPGKEQLREAKESMQAGDRLTEEELRESLATSDGQREGCGPTGEAAAALSGTVEEVRADDAVCWLEIAPGTLVRFAVPLPLLRHLDPQPGLELRWSPGKPGEAPRFWKRQPEPADPTLLSEFEALSRRFHNDLKHRKRRLPKGEKPPHE